VLAVEPHPDALAKVLWSAGGGDLPGPAHRLLESRFGANLLRALIAPGDVALEFQLLVWLEFSVEVGVKKAFEFAASHASWITRKTLRTTFNAYTTVA
jgi:hypothetical protein